MIAENDFEVSLPGFKLAHPLMNGAGTIKYLEGNDGLRAFAKSAAVAIVIGSITPRARLSPGGNIFCWGKNFSWNCVGLNNPGLAYYHKDLPEMVRCGHDNNKPIFVSLAGSKPSEFMLLAETAVKSGADGLEINFSCPNWEDSHLLCENPDFVGETLYLLGREIGADIFTSTKISLFFDPFTLKETLPGYLEILIQTIKGSELVKAITSSNTFPCRLIKNQEWQTQIEKIGGDPKKGGLAGPIIKQANLEQIRQMKMLWPEVKILAAGGVKSGQDVADYLRAGAKAVQVATAFLDKGPKIFDKLLAEFVDEVEKSNRLN